MLDHNTEFRNTDITGDKGVSASLLRQLLKLTGFPPVKVRLWNKICVSHPHPLFEVKIENRKTLLKLLLDPDFYFGEAYMRGNLDIKGNLVELLEYLYISKSKKPPTLYNKLNNFVSTLKYRQGLHHSKRNIHHHYDLGNNFYKIWLDHAAMQYTCAYFPTPNMSLEQAQLAKLEHVCRKLQLKKGESVVEAGSGWGGLALYMARHYQVKVTSYNISIEQVRYAREKAKQEKLDHLVNYIHDDYRNINGKFDVFVSIGMLEHVGLKHYSQLSQVMNNCLHSYGRGLVHSIGRIQPGRINAWIVKRIFPGAETPSLKQMLTLFEPDFSVLDVENLRLHYAKTLEHWLQRFESSQNQIKKMFDAEFIRAWRLYLAGSIAAFTTGNLQLFQILFTRAQNNEIPWSRSHLYK